VTADLVLVDEHGDVALVQLNAVVIAGNRDGQESDGHE
jgi:hypothetical protein